jgi:hypothetical protein
MNEPSLRVSDAERERAVEQLRAAAAEGRLATEELEQRIGGALAARTRGDLTALLSDLPAPVSTAGLIVAPDDRSMMLRRQLAGFITPNVVCLAVWAATGAHAFWPKWILLVTGVATITFVVRHALGIEDDHDHGDHHRHPPRPPRLPGL